jgi:hypothetical protein
MEGSNGKKSSSSSYNQAVSRSNELLSCAKTAWKILAQQEDDPSAGPPPPIPTLRLASSDYAPASLVILEEGLTLLRAMEFGLKQLQILVRRRGHTNDPTHEIATLVQQLEQDLKELTDFCEQLLTVKRRSQHKKHWELVVQWFQQVANQYSSQLKECLELRGNVLTQQALKRKKLVDKSSNKSKKSTSTKATATPLFDSPLFKAPPPPPPPPVHSTTNGHHHPPHPSVSSSSSSQPETTAKQQQQPYYSNTTTTNGTPNPTTTPNGNGSSTYYNGGGGGSGYGGGGGYGGGSGGGYGGGYGGDGGGYGGTGMRQRRQQGPSTSTTMDYNSNNTQQQQQQQEEQEEEKVHQQIQQRQQQRQTHQRLDEAQQAETMLGELGQLFGKMSTLISTQGEVLEKIEDDIENAHADVTAGQEEITTLYQLKKGNRPLIIKTFCILNFLIIFMRAYKK